MKRRNPIAYALLFVAGMVASNAEAQEEERSTRSWNLGVKGGLLTGGAIYVEEIDQDLDSDSGFMAMINLDAMVADKLSIGLLAVRGATTVSDEDVSITTLGGTIKGRFELGGFELRPGLSLGYQILGSELSGFEDTQGFHIGALLEAAVPVSEQWYIPVELGFLSQPVGGNDFSSITFAPIFYLLAGVEFGG